MLIKGSGSELCGKRKACLVTMVAAGSREKEGSFKKNGQKRSPKEVFVRMDPRKDRAIKTAQLKNRSLVMVLNLSKRWCKIPVNREGGKKEGLGSNLAIKRRRI